MVISCIVFQPSRGEDSVNSGRILAVMPAREGIAAKSGDSITAFSEPGKGADSFHGDGPSYGNEGCFGPTGIVSESCPLGVVLHDEGSEARKEPEAKVVSIMVIRCEERAYNCKLVANGQRYEETYREWEDLDAFREYMR